MYTAFAAWTPSDGIASCTSFCDAAAHFFHITMTKAFCLFAITLFLANVFSTDVPADDVNDAVEHGLAQVESMLDLERQLLEKGLTVDRGSSAHLHSLMVAASGSEQQKESALNAARILAASTRLKNKLNWSADEARRSLPLLSLDNTALKNSCPESITCPSAATLKYRPIDGSCHNLARPDWGKANTPFQRALPNAYADGVFEPRNSSTELKSPRAVSTTFIKPGLTTAADFTLMLMTWGQFITHDLTKASSFTSADGKTPQCCNATSGQPLNPDLLHPFCLPIDIPANDTFYSQHGQACMQFVRTQIGADYACTLGHAEQLNSITHWLDGSMIYGSSSSELNNLRLGQGGELKNSTTSDGMELLPLAPSCSDATCYYAGDVRAQENPQLAIVHTVMMREHNRIARALKLLNPLWTEEVLFQETRRIVIAELHHITYTEYLPAMLGEQAMRDYNLNPAAVDTFATYDETTAKDPSIWNEFAASVFRVGHSQVQGTLVLYDANDVQDQTFTLSSYFFDASKLPEPGFIDSAIRGLTKQMPLAVNAEYTSQLTNYLFKGSNPYGMDLVALNVQRGREHGIPDYNTVRAFCGLPKASTFDDLINEIDQATIDSLKNAYNSVDDIDLYIGCLAESARPVNGSLLGPTGLCVVARQFAVTKNNDRFFYDVGSQTNSFTLVQLNEIRKTSLARILCDNNNGDVSTMQPKAFRAPDAASNNGRGACSSIPSINLAAWKDAKASNPSKASIAIAVPSILTLIFISYLLV
ncbi:peroxidase-like [Daphnia pulex]|uniref:peroxidase-like n=1 Tax=Daphnia pulex TaxID=6669 RepID=UPI001EDDB137|nr:peroxidase-like [Daphnia pulex]XP_046451983.1 peroxidase-like [Daphnia pulex]